MNIKAISSIHKGFGSSGLPRSGKRIHLSEILSLMEEDIFGSMLKGANKTLSTYAVRQFRKDDPPYPGDRLTSLWEAGFVFESMLEMAFAERSAEFARVTGIPGLGLAVRPKEITRAGIICSPDGFIPACGEQPTGALLEYKLRWKSALNFDPEREWKIKAQIQSYLMALRSLKTAGPDFAPLVCFLMVFFVNGDYRGNFPILKSWKIEFTPGEIRENWNTILEYAGDKNLLNPAKGKGK
jgi:hypothetical protein